MLHSVLLYVMSEYELCSSCRLRLARADGLRLRVHGHVHGLLQTESPYPFRNGNQSQSKVGFTPHGTRSCTNLHLFLTTRSKSKLDDRLEPAAGEIQLEVESVHVSHQVYKQALVKVTLYAVRLAPIWFT